MLVCNLQSHITLVTRSILLNCFTRLCLNRLTTVFILIRYSIKAEQEHMTFSFVFIHYCLHFSCLHSHKLPQMNITTPKARNILNLHLCTPHSVLYGCSEFAMISLLGPGVILFIFILWLMMPPADYIKTVGSRIPAQTREQIHTHDLLV